MTASQLASRRRTLAPISAGNFSSFGDFAQTVATAARTAGTPEWRGTVQRLNQRLGASGASEQVPADGGFLVPTEFSQELYLAAYNTGQILQRCTPVPITKRSIKLPGIDEQSRAQGSRFGGVTSSWLNESDSTSGAASKMKLRAIELTLKKVAVLCYVTDEILQDAAALNAWLLRVASLEIAFRLEAAILSGSGAGQPQGILNSPALVTVAKVPAQASATILSNNVVQMWSQCWGPSRDNACWIVNQDAQQQLPSLSLTLGSAGSELPLYKFSGQDGEPDRLMGRPVIVSENAAALGQVGDITLVDLSRYMIADRGIESAFSMHVKFLSDESAFRFTLRVDGNTGDHSPVSPADGSANKLSAFVTLASRS